MNRFLQKTKCLNKINKRCVCQKHLVHRGVLSRKSRRNDSDGNQKKAKEKKGGGISASVKSPTKEAKEEGRGQCE